MHTPRFALVLILCLTFAPVAAAQGQDPAPQKSPHWETARKYHEVAQQLYNTGNYAQAVTEFKKAYDLVPLPGLLHNIARCQEVLGELKDAVKYYRLFLESKPDTPNKTVVLARIDNLEKRIERQKAAQPEPATPAPAPAPAPAPDALPPEPKPAGDAVPFDPAPREPNRTWKFTAGWVGVGLGVAALAAGLAFGALAADEASAYEDMAADGKSTYQELKEVKDRGQVYESVQVAGLIGGAVLGMAGAGLLVWELFFDDERAGEPATALIPFVGPDGGGLAGTFRF